jgi:hypothetical protein
MSAPTQCRLPLPGSMRESDALEFGCVAEELEARDRLLIRGDYDELRAATAAEIIAAARRAMTRRVHRGTAMSSPRAVRISRGQAGHARTRNLCSTTARHAPSTHRIRGAVSRHDQRGQRTSPGGGETGTCPQRRCFGAGASTSIRFARTEPSGRTHYAKAQRGIGIGRYRCARSRHRRRW